MKRFQEGGAIQHEREYKLEVGRNLAKARDAVLLSAEDWHGLLKRAFGKPNDLTPWQIDERFVKWCAADPDVAQEALHAIWDAGPATSDRITRFVKYLPRHVVSGTGGRLTLASFLLMGVDAQTYPIYRPQSMHTGYTLTEYGAPAAGADEAACYEHALSFFDRLIQEAPSRGLHLQDRLDAQSGHRCVTKWGPLERWPEHERQAFLHYRGPQPPRGPAGETTQCRPVGEGFAELAERLLLDEQYESDLRQIHQMLKVKRQVIFYGPPGTGKTYIAREFARYCAAAAGRVQIVQFHPSYAYEDFVEGYKPTGGGAQASFDLVAGPLKLLAAEAADHSDQTYILLIDEINRGNVAKVFGELYFLLEYRDEAISLQYSRTPPFKLPKNLSGARTPSIWCEAP